MKPSGAYPYAKKSKSDVVMAPSLPMQSSNFQQLGSFIMAKTKAGMIAGISEYYGDPIGALGVEYPAGMVWLTLTELEAESIHYLVAKGFPIGICGSLHSLNVKEEEWIHFSGNDLDTLTMALDLIIKALNKPEFPY